MCTEVAPMPKGEIKFEIVKHIGVLSSGRSGWNKEVNIVKWNDGKAKLDIRDWGPDHEKVGKGITLGSEDVAILKELLEEYDPYEIEE